MATSRNQRISCAGTKERIIRYLRLTTEVTSSSTRQFGPRIVARITLISASLKLLTWQLLDNSVVQRQTAVIACLKSKQLLLFAFSRHN